MHPSQSHSVSSVHPAHVALTAGALIVAAVTPLSGRPLSEPGFPQAIGMQLKTHNFDVATLERVHALGVRVVRRGFHRAAIEREEGTYTFVDYDVPMARARELGLTIIGCFFDARGAPIAEEQRQGFARFAAAVAKQYRDHDVIWEIWNEPNVRTFWRRDGMHNSREFAAEYTALVKAVMPAMLAADPDVFVVVGSVSNYWEPSYQWTEFCFQMGILATGIRGWSVHPYGVRTPEEYAIGHRRTRELLVKYGAPELPMLNTERGFSVRETAEGWSGGSKDRAREYQAWHFVRQLLIDQLHGVHPSVWYMWDGEEFGLADADGPRPAQAACRLLVEQLGGYRVVERLEADTPLVYVLLCANAAGDRKLVAWTAPPAGGSPDTTRDHTVAIALGDGHAALSLNLTGQPQYATLPAGSKPGRVATTSVADLAAPVAAAKPADAVDLKLFEEGVQWSFEKNNGDGSFTLAKDTDGTPMGVLSYDFSRARARGHSHVLALTRIDVAQGASALRLRARSSIAQQLTFRVRDSTGQTLQHKARTKGTGDWETIRIPLNRKLEHWGGANDGFAKFPLTSITFSVPRPSAETLTGKVEYAGVFVE